MTMSRRGYRVFFFGTAAAYGCAGLFTWLDPREDLWPGDTFWTIAFLVAAVMLLAVGLGLRKTVRRTPLLVRRLGLILAPSLLIARAIAQIAGNGWAGARAALWLTWAALVTIWAVGLLSRMPTEKDEWDELADEYRDLGKTVDDLRREVKRDRSDGQ